MKNASRIALGLVLVAGFAFAGCNKAARTDSASSTTEVKAAGSCCAAEKSAGGSCSDKAATTCTDKK